MPEIKRNFYKEKLSNKESHWENSTGIFMGILNKVSP